MRGHAAIYRATGGRVGGSNASGEERRDLWPKAVRFNPLWGRYQERTPRQIPLVLLEPR